MSSELLDIIDSLKGKAAQLESMLMLAEGNIDKYTEEVVENYIWACRELSTQIKGEIEPLVEKIRVESFKGVQS